MSMRAWVVERPQSVDGGPLALVDRSRPTAGPGEVLIKVSTCGVCRTDLHLAEGDLAPRRAGVTPGHEVVGRVDSVGEGSTRFRVGDRVGAAWLASSCGVCRFCARGAENICLEPRFTGWDVDGGYAPYLVAREDFLYELPDEFDDLAVAPLLCAGIIGFRALRRTEVAPGGILGIYGFGGSAHLTAQIALAEGMRVHVMTRSPDAQELARDLGAASVQGADDKPPEPLDGAILFAPVGDLVLPALEALDRGGTLAIAGIHLSDVPRLDYQRHLFQERTLRSVTANTRQDGRDFLTAAVSAGLSPTVVPYSWREADRALADLAHDRVTGAAVLVGFDEAGE